MNCYLYKRNGEVVGFNIADGSVGSGAELVSLQEFIAAGGIVPPHRCTELELVQQSITDLQLSDLEHGQAITDLELMILEARNV